MTTHNSFVHIQDGPQENILKIEEKDHLKSKNLQNNVQKINFVTPMCSACKDKMQFSEGDVIYGDKWYHSSCWKEIQKIVELVSQ